MNAHIVHPEGNESQAYLIDAHSVVLAPFKKGKLSQVAMKAIDIRGLRAGEIQEIDGKIYPRPCQLVAQSEFTVRDILWRGIYPDAAAALLSQPHGMKTEVSPGKALKLASPAAGYDQWKFLIAWGWSLWQQKQRAGEDWPMERRWEEMRNIGYPGELKAFRQLCRRLKLYATKSAPNM
jgi:hypothetical protein